MVVRKKLNIKETDDPESERPPSSTVLETDTAKSSGYLYQGSNHCLFIQQRRVQEGKHVLYLAFQCPYLEGTLPGPFKQSITVHLVALPAFPGRMDWSNSGLLSSQWQQSHLCATFPTPSPRHLSLVIVWHLGPSPGPLWTGHTRAPQVLPCPYSSRRSDSQSHSCSQSTLPIV